MLSLDWYYDAFPYVDYFIPNSMEAMKITGTDTPVQALERLSAHLKEPIVKNGNAGCLYKENKELHVIEPLPVKACGFYWSRRCFCSRLYVWAVLRI